MIDWDALLGDQTAQLGGWTRHGHRIEGVAQTVPQPLRVMRCGATRMCPVCQHDAMKARA